MRKDVAARPNMSLLSRRSGVTPLGFSSSRTKSTTAVFMSREDDELRLLVLGQWAAPNGGSVSSCKTGKSWPSTMTLRYRSTSENLEVE